MSFKSCFFLDLNVYIVIPATPLMSWWWKWSWNYNRMLKWKCQLKASQQSKQIKRWESAKREWKIKQKALICHWINTMHSFGLQWLSHLIKKIRCSTTGRGLEKNGRDYCSHGITSVWGTNWFSSFWIFPLWGIEGGVMEKSVPLSL